MYEFSGATDRILKMRDLVRNRCIEIDASRGEIVTDVYKECQSYPPLILDAVMLREICRRKPIRVEDFEVIVGNKGKGFCGHSVYPEWGPSWGYIGAEMDKGLWNLQDDGYYHNAPDALVPQKIRPEELDKIQEISEWWTPEKWKGTTCDVWKPDYYDELKELCATPYTDHNIGLLHLPMGHDVAGYEKIIRVGYKFIYDQANDWMEEHRGNLLGHDIEKYIFYKAVSICCEGAMTMVKRYSEACSEKAKETTDPARKAELEKMADGLMWISENPARNFWEAVQGIMMYQVFINEETIIPSPALGRFDQYVWPYLEKDLANGDITLEQAQEIVDGFFLKCNCFYSAGPDAATVITGVGNTYQHTTIGGVNRDTGEDATNPVTYMVLETVGRLKLHDPTISLRINKNTPDKLWECALSTSKLVGGLPLFQNDEVIIPTLMKQRHFTLRDARDYGVIGCQEIVGCGNDWPAGNGAHPPNATVYWSVILDMALNDGQNPMNKAQASLHTGYLYEMTNIEQVHNAFEKMIRYIFRMYISTQNYTEYVSRITCPQPGYSMSIEGCMESGYDVMNGGAKYNAYGGTATGLATVADSFTTIKYMCFDHDYCTTRELYDAFMANWEGYEELRQRCLNEVPHYGNADPYADMELKWCVDLWVQLCSEITGLREDIYTAGMYGAADHVAQGYETWATPDGRLAGTPIADAMSPAQARDKNGPTAIFQSTLCFDHHRFLGGMALNIRMHPTVLSNDQGLEKLRDMSRTFLDEGGMEFQYNVVDTDTLRDAQETPEDYHDLVVRIAGYSAYFVELDHDLQNDIISRNENMI
ncbi:MAG: pyruvate formate lyase family protein [Coriobacteriales bacterium]|jgi:pyruvate-formate lyase